MRMMLVAAALASVAATAAAHAEVVIVPFDDSTPTATTASYSGNVTVTVSGIGQSAGTELNDAFYVFTDPSGTPTTPDDRAFYDLGFGTGGSASSIDNYVFPAPAYNPTHTYTFNLNTDLVTPAPLDFVLVDDAYGDNTGSFSVSVNEAPVPEPASWALMLVGFGILGGMARRTRIRAKSLI